MCVLLRPPSQTCTVHTHMHTHRTSPHTHAHTHTHAPPQDFLTCAFLVTSKDRFYTRAEICGLVAFMSDAREPVDLPSPALMKPLELWTGKQLFSLIVRPNAQTRWVVYPILRSCDATVCGCGCVCVCVYNSECCCRLLHLYNSAAVC